MAAPLISVLFLCLSLFYRHFQQFFCCRQFIRGHWWPLQCVPVELAKWFVSHLFVGRAVIGADRRKPNPFFSFRTRWVAPWYFFVPIRFPLWSDPIEPTRTVEGWRRSSDSRTVRTTVIQDACTDGPSFAVCSNFTLYTNGVKRLLMFGTWETLVLASIFCLSKIIFNGADWYLRRWERCNTYMFLSDVYYLDVAKAKSVCSIDFIRIFGNNNTFHSRQPASLFLMASYGR